MPQKRAGELVESLLVKFVPKLKSNKKSALEHFSKQLSVAADELSEADAKRLLEGGAIDAQKKNPGLLAICGHLSKKDKSKPSLARIASKALTCLRELMDPDQYKGAAIVQKIFAEVDRQYIALMRLQMHLQTGNKEAAEYFHGLVGEVPDVPLPSKVSMINLTSSCEHVDKGRSQSVPPPVRMAKRMSQSQSCSTSAAQKESGGMANILDLLNSFFAQRKDPEELAKAGVLRVGKVFNVPIEKVASTEGVPNIVRDLCTVLLKEQDTLEQLGLFRVSGNSTNIVTLKQTFDFEEAPPDLTTYGCHELTGTLKLFLRELPEPLFTFDLYDTIVEAMRQQDKEKVYNLIQSLPSTNLATWNHLRILLREVAKYKTVNKMSSQNISIVVAPNILRRKIETFDQIARDTQVTCSAVEYLLDHD